MTIKNNIVKILIVLLGVAILSIVLLNRRANKLRDDAERMSFNFSIANQQITRWRTVEGNYVARQEALELKAKELEKVKDSSIIALHNIIKKQGVKVKNLEYELSIESGLQIDTIVEVKVDTIDRYIRQMIDSIEIGDLKLRHMLFLKGDKYYGKFTASYTPTLYVGISTYKDAWRFKNIFHRRDVKYQCIVTTSDSLLKPKSMQIIKLDK